MINDPTTPFDFVLQKKGLSESRITDTRIAIDKIHYAISKMDKKNKSIMFKKSLKDWVNLFGKYENLAQF